MDCLKRIHKALARETSSGLFIPEIDGLRFFAIVSVFLFHVDAYLRAKSAVLYGADLPSQALETLLSQGRFGVQLFFVISGLILSLPFAAHYLEGKPAPRLKDYFLRRLTRIEPPYVINICICFCLLLAVNHVPFGLLLPHFLASLGYTHNIVYQEPSLLNTVAWSLEIEVQFYLLAPLLALVFAIGNKWTRRSVLLALAVAVSLLQLFVLPVRPATLLSALQYFLVGFLLTDLYLADWRRAPQLHWRWDLCGALGWIGVFVLRGLDAGWRSLLPVAIGLACLGALRGPLTNRIVKNRALVLIGGMCYTLYLYHPFVISGLGRVLLKIPIGSVYWIHFTFIASVLSCATLLVCTVLFLLTEKPFMRRDWPARFRSWIVRRFASPNAVEPAVDVPLTISHDSRASS